MSRNPSRHHCRGKLYWNPQGLWFRLQLLLIIVCTTVLSAIVTWAVMV